jgi:hypothetical protein
VNDAGGVDVLDSFEDGADKARSIAVMDVRREDAQLYSCSRLVVVPFCTYSIKELATSAEIEAEVEVV